MIRRTFDLLPSQKEKFPNPRAIVSRKGDRWVSYSSSDCLKHIDQYAGALLGAGVKRGDRVLIVPHLASAEWIFLDFAIQQIGAIVVPVHFTSHPDQLQYIIEHTEAQLCFVAHANLGAKFAKALARFPRLQIYFMEGVKDTASIEDFLHKFPAPATGDLDAIKDQVQEDDLSAIIYTSGTTGVPKGVMLSHRNIVSNVLSTLPLLPVEPGKVALSFLPFSHIFERMALLNYIAGGLSVHTLVERSYLSPALLEIRPHIFTAVPRILEKMYDQVLAIQADHAALNRGLINWALKIGMSYRERPGFRFLYWLKLQVAKLLVLHKLKRNLGGRVHAIIVGAAYLQPGLGRLMGAMGIKAREGYGMTETAAAASINRFQPGLYAFGTVGLPVSGVQIKIDNPDEEGEGEILIKGPNVMQGYYKQEAETAKVFTADGWLRTGDIGKFVNKRFLQITDRKKDIFKTSSGKYIAPLVLENHFKRSPLIEQIMVVGFQKPYVTALIYPNYELLEHWSKENKVHWTSPQYMANNIKVRQRIQEEIDRHNQDLPNYQTVRAFHLLHQEWTMDSGLLTYTMKLVRPKILATFEKEIEHLYQA